MEEILIIRLVAWGSLMLVSITSAAVWRLIRHVDDQAESINTICKLTGIYIDVDNRGWKIEE